jgi:galactokinase
VEVLFGKIFDNLYGAGKLTALEIAQISQRAENEYFGKPCGLMDQTACAFGGAVAIDFANPQTPRVRRIQVDFEKAGYALCVVNTRGSHADLTADYAAIPEEMKAVARYFGKEVLREVKREQVITHAAELRSQLGDRAILRAIHFFNDNDRVDCMCMALEGMQEEAPMESPPDSGLLEGMMGVAVESYLHLVSLSGESSWELLQNLYSPKNPREQGISLALALTRDFFSNEELIGACRVHGGGFAGTIQVYVPSYALPSYKQSMETVFGAGALTVLRIRPVGVTELGF